MHSSDIQDPMTFTRRSPAALAAVLITAAAGFASASEPPGRGGEAVPVPGRQVYSEDFSKTDVGSVPEDFIVIEGNFAVREEDGERFLELPGAPLDSFMAMFGPAHKENWGVQARFHGTSTGRKYPVFAVSLSGLAGYRLSLAPAKRALEILRDQEVQASVPYQWKSGTWTILRLQLRRAAPDRWVLEGKAWAEGSPEPSDWLISWEETSEPIEQRPAIWGMPYSGTPIRFDDLAVFTIGEAGGGEAE